MANKIELTEAAREAKRIYMREWRERNRERKAEQEARYWQRKAFEMGLADTPDRPDINSPSDNSADA